MTTYRTGNHWGVTIVREGLDVAGEADQLEADQLVAVVVNGDQALAERICALLNADDGTADVIRNLATVREAAEAMIADSCTCTVAGPDPACVVHQGRRARGPKPPPLGPGCVCDGSGRPCPRHGVVL